MPEVGDRLKGKYQLVRFIGEGGMGVVWEGLHTTIGKQVAIKFLRKDTAESASFKKLVREAQIASSVGHSSIVTVFDVDVTDDGMPFMVMEYLEGESLETRLDRMGTLVPEEAIRVVVRVLQALEMVHRRGVVHRDLKPDNVYLCAPEAGGEVKIRTLGSPPQGEVKILDFGLSKMSEDGPQGKLSHSGPVMGTPYYMSPEQARGEREIDKRTDIFSVGVILYECLAGAVPFDGETYNEIFYAILSSEPDLERLRDGSVPERLVRIVGRALAKDPADRYQSCAEMESELERYLSASRKSTVVVGKAGPVPTSTARPRDAGRGRRVVLGVLGVLVLAAALVAAAWAAGILGGGEPARTPPGEHQDEVVPAGGRTVERVIIREVPVPVEPEPAQTGDASPPVKESKPRKTAKAEEGGAGPPAVEKVLKKAGHGTAIDTRFGD